MRKLIFIVFLFSSSICLGQYCKCDSTFHIVKYHIETNYAGWFDKINQFDRTAFDELTNSVSKNTKSISIDSLCYKEIKKYVAYFKDDHLHLNLRASRAQNKTESKPIEIETIHITETELLGYLNSSKKIKPVEGIWENETYKIGITKSKENPKLFNGVILTSKNENWILGEVKLTIKQEGKNAYRLTFITGDKTEAIENKAFIFKNILDARDLTLSRVFPISKETVNLDDYALETDPTNPKLSFPKKDLAVWTFPNFFQQNLDVVKILLQKHKSKLETTKNWIIDLRSNEGGDVKVGNELLPYLYTKPIIWSTEFSRLTEDNFNKWYNTYVRDYYESLSKPEQQQIDSIFAITKSNFGKFGRWMSNENIIADTISFNTTTAFPEKVVILIDQNTFSSGELFTILARQSGKVVVMGEKSAGTIDYGNVLRYKTNCPSISLSLPSSRNNWLDKGISIDRDKVQPDLYIPKNVSNWINYVFKKLKK